MPHKNYFIHTAIAASLLSFFSTAYAESTEEILVVGSKIPKKVVELTHSVSVVDEEEIENESFTDVTEILRKEVGLEFKQSGGVGQFNYLKLRGLSSKYVLIVVDGVKINKPSSGNTGNLLSQLDPDNIESIEILRGPQATLYGANNSAGVISITTKDGNKPVTQIGAEFGSLNWRKLKGALRNTVSAGNGKVIYSLNISDTDSDNTHKYEFFEDRTLQGKLSYEQEKLKIGLTAFDADNSFGSAELDETYSKLTSRAQHWAYQTPDPRNTSSTTQKVHSLFTEYEFSDQWSHRLQVSQAKNTYEINDPFDGFLGTQVATIDGIVEGAKKGDTLYIYDRLFPGIYTEKLDLSDPSNSASDVLANYEDKTNQYNYDIRFRGDIFNFIAGIERLAQKAKQYGSYGNSNAKDSQVSYYTNGDVRLLDENLVLALGVRHDDYNSWGGQTTGNIGASWQIGVTNIYTNYGTSFTPATLNELYSVTYGDSSITPGEGKTYELGIRQTAINERLSLEATYWNTKIDNAVIYDSTKENPRSFSGFGQYNNAQKLETSGVELQVAFEISDSITLDGNYTYTDSRGRKKDQDWQRTVQIARNKANLGLYYDNNALNLGVNAYYAGPRLRWNGDVEMKEYVRVDLSGRYKFDSGLALSARIENLLDEDIEEGLGYEEPGIYAIAGIDYKF